MLIHGNIGVIAFSTSKLIPVFQPCPPANYFRTTKEMDGLETVHKDDLVRFSKASLCVYSV